MRDKTPQESMAESLVATLKLLREQEQINEQLLAQVEQLRDIAKDAIHFAIKRKDKVCADPMFVMQQLQNRIDTTPAQHLAEIKAQAVIDAIDAHKNKLLTFDFDTAIRVTDLIKYANKLRQSVKE